ncbi:MAG: Enoyl-CoA hydratase/isomerase [Nocardioidaceae bacterium]|nr:Enoyl-CoA hydratase/isomerase [Nocardioidaceae bacterium]
MTSYDGWTPEALRVQVDAGVAIVTLCRPERGNSFSGTLCREIGELALRLDSDPRVRSVLIRAEGRWFSTGGELNELGRSRDEAPAFIKEATMTLHSGLSRLARMNAPVVVAMRGGCIGAGAALPAAADFCLATPAVTFTCGYPAIGMTVDAGLSWFLPRRVGSRATADYFLRNRTWTAEEAHRIGLVSEVVPDDELDGRSEDLARELAAGPTAAFGEVKNLLLDTFGTSLEEQLEREARSLARAAATDDGWGGITALSRRETPTFTGR